MELWTLFWRTLLIYFVIFIVMRLMGKREIGKLSVFDLVISILIAEIAVFIIDDPKMPLINGLLPMATLVCIQILLAYVTLKSQTIRGWFDGKPSYLIENGKLNQKEMKKQRYTLDDLIMQLREKQVTNMADVEFAILETSGKLSVIEKDGGIEKDGSGENGGSNSNSNSNSGKNSENEAGSKRSGPGSANRAPEFRNVMFEGLPLPLIMDGKVQEESLQKLGKTRFWLKNQLQTKGVYDFKEVFFCSIDHRGRIYLNRKTTK